MKKKNKEQSQVLIKCMKKEDSKSMNILSKKVARETRDVIQVASENKRSKISSKELHSNKQEIPVSKFKITHKITNQAREFDALVQSLIYKKKSPEKEAKILLFNHDKGFTLADLEMIDLYPHLSL